MLKTIAIPALLSAFVILTGCTTIVSPQADSQAPNQAAAAPPQDSEALPPAAFEPEILYSLLVAELAGQRNRYDILLSNYLHAAKTTRDPGIAEHATRIAASLKADKATLAAAELWHQIAPSNIKAKQVLSMHLIQAGRVEEAMVLLEDLLRSTGEANFEYLAVSSKNWTQPQRNAVLTELDKLYAAFPKNTHLLSSQAIILQLSGRTEDALIAAKKLHRIQQDTQSLSLKSKLNHQLGHTDTALRELKSELARNPGNKALRILYAQMLIDAKQLAKAQQQFSLLVDQAPDNGQLKLTLALLELENGFSSAATQHLTELLHNPKLADEAHYYLAQAAEKSQQAELAITHYQQVSNGSKFIPAYHRLGALLLEQNRPGDLNRLFEQARQASPHQTKNLYIVEAELLVEKNYTDKATRLINTALKHHPDDINLLYARAMSAEKANDLQGMENDLRKILALQPDNAMVLNALGYTLANRTTRYQEALELIIRAKQLKPDDPAITDSLGWAQYRLGNYEEAIKLLEEALSGFPDHEVAAHLGEVLWTVGQHQRAEQVWKEALQLTPDSPILKGVIERLHPDLMPR